MYNKRHGEQLPLDLKSQSMSGQYKNFARVSSSDFEDLINKAGPLISKKERYMRAPISVQDRLAVTLRFLATGDSFTSLQCLFRISNQAISKIVPEVCAAVVENLKEYIKLPKTPPGWKDVEEIFVTEWNLPHCVGAIDGKHVLLQAPINLASNFFNYKEHFSIVLFALVDGDYNFLFADVGFQGRISEGGVFKECKLYSMIEDKTIGLPPPETLTGRKKKVPYFFVGDSAFSLAENLMKPFPGDHAKGSGERVFNYRLSRARQVVENAFGISSAVLRVLRKPMLLEPNKAELVVMSIVMLHNYLRANSPILYTPPGSLDYEENGVLIEGSWRKDQAMTSMMPLRRTPRKSVKYCKAIRNEIADYCLKEGAVTWQHEYA